MRNNLNKNKNIKEAIIEVVAFFDLFDYPLTEFELWQCIGVKCGLSDVRKVLDESLLDGNKCFSASNGFYFLRGRKENIETKMRRYNYADKKFKKAILVSRFFKIIPWIKIIAVGNIIGAHNLKKESDIDLFIITSRNRVWLTRFFCAGFAQFFGLRPTEKNKQDKICLSFFISEDVMDLQGLMLNFSVQYPKSEIRNPKSEIDIYFIYWLAGLMPIYDKYNIYEKFIKANSWLEDYLPNWQSVKINCRRDSGNGFSGFYEDVADLLIGGMEKTIKKIQLKKFPEKLKILMNKDTRVVINNDVLKLYTNDRREEYRKMWEKSLLDIKLKNWILR